MWVCTPWVMLVLALDVASCESRTPKALGTSRTRPGGERGGGARGDSVRAAQMAVARPGGGSAKRHRQRDHGSTAEPVKASAGKCSAVRRVTGNASMPCSCSLSHIRLTCDERCPDACACPTPRQLACDARAARVTLNATRARGSCAECLGAGVARGGSCEKCRARGLACDCVCPPIAARETRPTSPARLFVLLTMAINPFLDLTVRGMHQQRNVTERLVTYQRSVRAWADNSSLPVVVVENTGADLAPLRAQVTNSARAREFEFHSLPVRANLSDDIGAAEANAVIDAIDASTMLRARRRKYDLVFKITGRYFVPDFERIVRSACELDGNGASPPSFVVTRSPWMPKFGRQETTVIGFDSRTQGPLINWAKSGGKFFEGHATRLLADETCKSRADGTSTRL